MPANGSSIGLRCTASTGEDCGPGAAGSPRGVVYAEAQRPSVEAVSVGSSIEELIGTVDQIRRRCIAENSRHGEVQAVKMFLLLLSCDVLE